MTRFPATASTVTCARMGGRAQVARAGPWEEQGGSGRGSCQGCGAHIRLRGKDRRKGLPRRRLPGAECGQLWA